MTELKERQALPLLEKIKWAVCRYIDFLEVYHGRGVYIGFSGGKDSQTLVHIIQTLHSGELEHLLENEYLILYNILVKGKPMPPLVFCDTGLEFPEIRNHVKKFSNVTWLKPAKIWTDVIQEHGFLVGSKKLSRQLQTVRNPTENNEATRTLYLTGYNSEGKFTKDWKIPDNWVFLIDAPFEISGKCCDVFKKDPFIQYENKTNRVPISATTTDESAMRRVSYLKTGCNSFEEGKEISRPLSIWKEEDVWEYSLINNIRFAEVYYERQVPVTEMDGRVVMVTVDGEKRTGCMFCGIGSKKQLTARFARLRITHNKQYLFIMNSPKIDMRGKFTYMGIMNKIEPKQVDLFE